MPKKENVRANIWKVILEVEDAADLTDYLADPETNPWPLVEDETAMNWSLERRIRGALITLPLPSGGLGRIVGFRVDPPEDEEFVRESSFCYQLAVERGAAAWLARPADWWPQTPEDAASLLRSALAYLNTRSSPVDDYEGQLAAQTALRDAEMAVLPMGTSAQWELSYDVACRARELRRIAQRRAGKGAIHAEQ